MFKDVILVGCFFPRETMFCKVHILGYNKAQLLDTSFYYAYALHRSADQRLHSGLISQAFLKISVECNLSTSSGIHFLLGCAMSLGRTRFLREGHSAQFSLNQAPMKGIYE